MNKNTTVELTFSTNRFWELSMSDLGYTEGMTEEQFNAKIADFINSDDFVCSVHGYIIRHILYKNKSMGKILFKIKL